MTEQLDLTANERHALIALLRRTVDYTRYPRAPRLDPLKAILAKLDPPPAAVRAITAAAARYGAEGRTLKAEMEKLTW